MLVLSCSHELQVFALPEDIASGDVGPPRVLVHMRTLSARDPSAVYAIWLEVYRKWFETGGSRK
jgi:hypothetical protein